MYLNLLLRIIDRTSTNFLLISERPSFKPCTITEFATSPGVLVQYCLLRIRSAGKLLNCLIYLALPILFFYGLKNALWRSVTRHLSPIHNLCNPTWCPIPFCIALLTTSFKNICVPVIRLIGILF